MLLERHLDSSVPIDGDLNGYFSGRSTRTFHTPPSYGARAEGKEKKNLSGANRTAEQLAIPGVKWQTRLWGRVDAGCWPKGRAHRVQKHHQLRNTVVCLENISVWFGKIQQKTIQAKSDLGDFAGYWLQVFLFWLGALHSHCYAIHSLITVIGKMVSFHSSYKQTVLDWKSPLPRAEGPTHATHMTPTATFSKRTAFFGFQCISAANATKVLKWVGWVINKMKKNDDSYFPEVHKTSQVIRWVHWVSSLRVCFQCWAEVKKLRS